MIGKIILSVMLVILIGLAAYFSYNLYLNVYSEPLIFKVNRTELENKPSYTSELQFYPDMRFNHNRLSYDITEECDEDKKNDVTNAFIYLENKTSLRFYESSEPDIEIKCAEETKNEESEFFVAGEGGPTSIVNTSLFGVILRGKILLLYEESCPSNPYNIALHELLHVLGFQHSENKESIMYNVSSCNQVLTNDIVNEIERLYSVEALPDLYFSDVNAIKKGSYVNINFSVRNQGLVDAREVKVLLYAEEKEEETFELGSIEFGAGKIISVENIRVHLKTESLKLVIQNSKELNEKNNQVFLTLQD